MYITMTCLPEELEVALTSNYDPLDAIYDELAVKPLTAYELSVRLHMTMAEVYKHLSRLKARRKVVVFSDEGARVWERCR